MSWNNPATALARSDAARESTLPTVWPCTVYPLKKTYDGADINFSLLFEIADKVDL